MKEKIIAILSDLRPEFDFTDESLNFIEEGMLDSFDVVCLVDALDTEFNIVIDGIDILPENFSTIESIEALLKKNGVAPSVLVLHSGNILCLLLVLGLLDCSDSLLGQEGEVPGCSASDTSYVFVH